MKKDGKIMEFVEPDGLIYPPKEVGDGEFNLGNEIYNKFYNDEENKEYKEMKEGQLKKAMKQAISNILDF
jgi:sulfatase maturation enzyme AslB (radical SAM superfamily)